MIKVLLVDDEPLIRQGMKIIIDWEAYGYEIAAEAENGMDAIEILKQQEMDLVFVDLRMPGMSGLEMIERIKKDKDIAYKIHFIILTGYAEFSYAKEALRLSVDDYLLKPIQENELSKILSSLSAVIQKEKLKISNADDHIRKELDIHMGHILLGKYMETDLNSVREYLPESEIWQYISFEIQQNQEKFQNLGEKGKDELQKQCDTVMQELLQNWNRLAVSCLNQEEQIVGAGMILIPQICRERQMDTMEYITYLKSRMQQKTGWEMQVYVGIPVAEIHDISQSYYSIRMTRCMHDFSEGMRQPITVSGDIKGSRTSIGMSGKDVEELIAAVRANDKKEIKSKTQTLYQQIQNSSFNINVLHTKVYYLLYRLIELANELDSEANQEEVIKHIGQESFDKIVLNGTADELTEFICAYAKYLEQLRKMESDGILGKVEQYIQDHYAQNISLKSIGEQFFINNVYLGQIFKKKKGMSFKEYLNQLRILKAAVLLETTDEKIYTIAEQVGFHNTDYFISKFVQEKGMTPTQYRKEYKRKKGQCG